LTSARARALRGRCVLAVPSIRCMSGVSYRDVLLAVVTGLQGFKKLVVIKRLHQSLVEQPVMRELFLQEARLAARLNHPNVVQTNDVGELDGRPFLSMEYLEGQPLRHLVRHWSGDARLAARIISDALAGLHHAHELCDFDGTPLNLVHGDLSPQNIFLTYDGVVKIVDFGIAKTAKLATKTEVGVFKGKFAYMAPEQLADAEIDRRVDLFVIGIRNPQIPNEDFDAYMPGTSIRGSTTSWRSTSTRTATGPTNAPPISPPTPTSAGGSRCRRSPWRSTEPRSRSASTTPSAV
jgi:serine/threonine protein kinase